MGRAVALPIIPWHAIDTPIPHPCHAHITSQKNSGRSKDVILYNDGLYNITKHKNNIGLTFETELISKVNHSYIELNLNSVYLIISNNVLKNVGSPLPASAETFNEVY